MSDTSGTDTTTSSSPSSSPPAMIPEELLQKEITCQCDDGDIAVRLPLLVQSRTFDNMWKDLDMSSNPETDFTFPVKSIKMDTMSKVVEWMENHVGKPDPVLEEDPTTLERKWFEMTDYEKQFFEVDVEQLADYLMAANYLDLKSLYYYGCQAMAALIKDKNPEEIRELFGFEDDLSEEEKADIRRKNVWCNY